MAIKSANVIARVEPAIKEEAEHIMAELGIPVSTAINMFYRQVINEKGLPFQPRMRSKRPVALSEMSQEEFEARMLKGIEQVQNGQDLSVEEAFIQIREKIGIGNGDL